MGEVVATNENGTELLQAQETGVVGQQAEKGVTAEDGGGVAAAEGGGLSAVRWERFLPKMVVRVLLVEADDSTRQIIAALLRKCSYRVAAVSDGLQAWEVLKGRSHNIDLILTEVELPSISGYALLTLIMEHDLCKNIPVIMMSSQDSVSTVYKCMLRGAADFLVKPVRKNELRNLWQHVWRRQASSSGAGPGPPDDSEAQQNVEATAENNETNNYSSGYMACVQRNRERIEKGSDAQSSCTKPELETEGADMEHNHCLSQPETDKLLPYNDINLSTQEKCLLESRELLAHENEAGESQAIANLEMNYATTREHDKNPDNAPEQVNVACPSSKNNNINILGNSSREAIDLIGAFDNYPKGNFRSSGSNASTNKFDILSQLDLSLRRCHPSSSVNQVNDDTRRLNHSDASAFSRYINKPLPARNSTSPSTYNQHKEHETNSEKQFSNHTPDYNSDAHGQTISSQKHVPLAKTIQPVRPEITFPYPQQRQLSHPIPVRGERLFENLTNGYGSPVPRMYCAQSGVSPLPSPGTATQSEPFPRMNLFYPSDGRPSSSSQWLHNLMDNSRINNPIDQIDSKQGQKFENMDVSSANDQSGISSFYNSNTSYYHSADSGSNGAILTVNARSECGNEDVGLSRSSQREAALTKFRLKRKGRCFEKKVRYESRKKLAEHRPRVKGQFVRQVANDPPPGNSSAG